MRPLRYSINVTLDGCCDHRAIPADEDLDRLESGPGAVAMRYEPAGGRGSDSAGAGLGSGSVDPMVSPGAERLGGGLPREGAPGRGEAGLPVIGTSCPGRLLRLVVTAQAPIRPQEGLSDAREAQDTVSIRCGDDW